MSGTFGYSQQKKVLHYDYLYWTSSVTWHFSPNIGVDVRYYSGLDLGAEKEHIAGWQFRPHVVDNRVLFYHRRILIFISAAMNF